jgi:hypothetical protein
LVLSPRFAQNLASALLDHNEVTLSFFVHVGLQHSANWLSAFVQGVFGAGKTYTTATLVFLTQLMLGHKKPFGSHATTSHWKKQLNAFTAGLIHAAIPLSSRFSVFAPNATLVPPTCEVQGT